MTDLDLNSPTFKALPCHIQARKVSEAMRAMNPEKFDEAAAVVRDRVAVAKAAGAFAVKH